MIKQYVIKNCPNYDDTNYLFSCNAKGILNCQDCTDCLLKQIVEKCKYYQKKIGRTPQHRAGFVDATNDILQLLDIEDVE